MRQRMVVNIGDEDGNVGLLDFRISTFESGDGDVYNFDSAHELNEEVVEAVKGQARRHRLQDRGQLTQPAKKTVELDSAALFPSQHMQAIIDAALAKRKFLAVNIYEGAGTGEESDAATAAIGRRSAVGVDDASANGRSRLAGIGRLLRAQDESEARRRPRRGNARAIR